MSARRSRVSTPARPMQEPLGAFRVKAAAKAVSRALRSRGRGALDALGHEARLSHSAPVRPSKYGPPLLLMGCTRVRFPPPALPPLLIETTRFDRFGRKTSMKSRPASPCQRGGRRFEPGLVLQKMERPDRSRDWAFLVRVMVGGLLGPLPPPAHPQQRHQAAQPRGQQRLARRSGLFEVR